MASWRSDKPPKGKEEDPIAEDLGECETLSGLLFNVYPATGLYGCIP